MRGNVCKPIVVSIDGLTEGLTDDLSKFNAYELDPRGWNGFAVPGFDLEQAKVLVEVLDNELFSSCKWQEDGTIRHRYGDEDLTISPIKYTTEDGEKELYCIGEGWVWDLVKRGHGG